MVGTGEGTKGGLLALNPGLYFFGEGEQNAFEDGVEEM
jgi:hypothetical protein